MINKFALNIIRDIADERVINKIMAMNRFVVLASALLLISLTWALNITRFDPLVAILYILPIIALANGLWLRFSNASEVKNFHFLSQTIIDTALILIAVYFSGKLYSDFLFVPLIVLSLAALVSWRLSLVSFLISLGFYLFLFFYQMIGLSIGEVIESLGGLNGMRFIRILIFAFMGALTGFAISYFINEIKRRNKEIEEVKRKAYADIVRSLCDTLTGVRWITEEIQSPDFSKKNKEFYQDILGALIDSRDIIKDKVISSLETTNRDFFSDENLKKLKLLNELK